MVQRIKDPDAVYSYLFVRAQGRCPIRQHSKREQSLYMMSTRTGLPFSISRIPRICLCCNTL
ncbi:hypothetical protein CC77DRAFT_752339 [Alternaria alternata]|uniref:Uncharacterized protein n=1 Tax=Alternaria alternata TaxID=5599 RepID=A0A177DSY6_ALTAL|nr:hypothetical protein CC77DRAFT_752339 [Alternaria alternata]OAG21869.1 hypothetical protein CC77DRAFT_752339 [Alternaria alternata]